MNVSQILHGFEDVLREVLMAMSPVLVLFLVFLLVFKLPRKMLLNLAQGVLFAFAGLALFLQGVHVGFLPVGNEMGAILGGLAYRWILIPFGFILGFVATLAEPAVRILCNQVEKSSSGSIRSNTILLTLCLAVGIFIALGMTRIVYGIPFYYIIIPGYLAAIILMIFSKPSFTSIAFDSGGVATGPMTVTFIMAMAVGAADRIEGRDAVVDGFGLIALVALAPIILVMILGFIYPDDGSEVPDEDEDTDSEPENNGEDNDILVEDLIGIVDEHESGEASPDPPRDDGKNNNGGDSSGPERPAEDHTNNGNDSKEVNKDGNDSQA